MNTDNTALIKILNDFYRYTPKTISAQIISYIASSYNWNKLNTAIYPVLEETYSAPGDKLLLHAVMKQLYLDLSKTTNANYTVNFSNIINDIPVPAKYIESSWVDFRRWLSKDFDYCVNKSLEQDFICRRRSEKGGKTLWWLEVGPDVRNATRFDINKTSLDVIPISCSNSIPGTLKFNNFSTLGKFGTIFVDSCYIDQS